jgi:hypothetical protein
MESNRSFFAVRAIESEIAAWSNVGAPVTFILMPQLGQWQFAE